MKPHEEWLFKAENDLESAKLVITSERKLYDISVYHSQQCAEKSLKAYLAFNNQKIEKTHSLIILLKQCELLNEEFTQIRKNAKFLNPFSTIYRYPDNELLPSLDDTREAINHSESFLNFVKTKINHQTESVQNTDL